MFSANKKLYAVTVVTLAALLPVLFIPLTYCRIVAAVIMTAATGVTMALIKKRDIPSINYRLIAGLLAVIAIVYTVLRYVMGVWLGFYLNATPLSIESFLQYILPVAVIIIATELIRYVLLAQSKRSVTILAYIICIVCDLLIGGGIAAATRGIYHFMDVIGLALFPAVTSNLLYHYLAKRYGAAPGIVYRLLLTLPISFLPVVPAISDVLDSFLLILLPLAVWGFVDILYGKKAKVANRRMGRLSYLSLGVTVLCMVALVMLISGQFQYRLLIIATPSMTGELNVGDAVIYEEYEGEVIEEDAVIVFGRDEEMVIVHRVVDIQQIDGQVRYITKGDANDDIDSGYITSAEIRGIVRFKVPYIGNPTLWLRDILS